jgi:hypothetical protein
VPGPFVLVLLRLFRSFDFLRHKSPSNLGTDNGRRIVGSNRGVYALCRKRGG